jgi:hypothetical protein
MINSDLKLAALRLATITSPRIERHMYAANVTASYRASFPLLPDSPICTKMSLGGHGSVDQ